MKQVLERLLIGGLTPCFRRFCAAGRACRLTGWKRMLRHALWKARLAGLGEGTIIHPWVAIHGPENVRIGARCSVAEFVHLWGGGGVTIGNDVLIASHVAITSITHDKDAPCFRETTVRAPVVIGDNVWIGAGAIILPVSRLGRAALSARGPW